MEKRGGIHGVRIAAGAHEHVDGVWGIARRFLLALPGSDGVWGFTLAFL